MFSDLLTHSLTDSLPARSSALRAPFPWFGGKSRAAHLVWPRLGDVMNYVEPFYGSGAVHLLRPASHHIRAETVNDADGFIANFWRATIAEPLAVARWADWPVNEVDLHARHQWLVNQVPQLREHMMCEPDYYDVKIAGWWVWGLCQWIGAGWCYKREHNERSRQSPEVTTWRKRPDLRRGGRGVQRLLYRPRPTNIAHGIHGRKLWRARPAMVANGIHRQLPDISGDSGAYGRGVHRCGVDNIYDWFEMLQARLRRVRVCCGDFERVLGPSPTYKIGQTGVFLDPPYSANRDKELYRSDCMQVAHRARQWAIDNGHHPKMRIALCGLEGEHDMPKDWECVAWKSNGGYGNRKANGRGRANACKERIWFSPNCLKV